MYVYMTMTIDNVTKSGHDMRDINQTTTLVNIRLSLCFCVSLYRSACLCPPVYMSLCVCLPLPLPHFLIVPIKRPPCSVDTLYTKDSLQSQLT